MPRNSLFGPSVKSCARCRHHKRKCDRAHPSCSLCSRLGQAELCVYDEPTSPPTGGESSTATQMDDVLTPPDIKRNIIKYLSHTNPRKVMAIYSKTIHPWFHIFSSSTVHEQHAETWDEASVDFTLLCFTMVLLNCTPKQIQGVYTLDSAQSSMHLMSKTWIATLEGIGLSSINFVKARLVITLFEVSHGFAIPAYLSISSAVRAADALVVFSKQGGFQATAIEHSEEYNIMWWGIAVLDRYIATENGKWPPVTKCRPVPPESLISNPSYFQEPTPFSRLFESSALLDKIHTTIHQPTSEVSFNIEEVTMIVNTLRSLETVIVQTIPENAKFFSSCLTLTSTALLLACEKGSKSACTGTNMPQAIAALDALIEDIVERVADSHIGGLESEGSTIPSFVTFLVYKAAAIVTGRLQNDIEPEANLLKLRTLRDCLTVTAERWLSGERFLKLLDANTSPRIARALEDKLQIFT